MPNRSELLIVLLLVVLTAATFWPAVFCPFTNYDDPLYVTDNPRVRQGLAPEGLVWACTTEYGANWHPLTWLSLMLDYQLFGDDPRGYHAVNLALHVANVVLVFLVLDRMTGALVRSALVAALFAVHPLRVESVVWVSERKDVLSACFGLAAILAYASWIRSPGRLRYGLVLLPYTLSLLAKPMLVTLPFLLLLLDYWPLGRLRLGSSTATALSARSDFRPPRTPWELIFEKLPLFGLAAVSCVVTFLAQSQSKAVETLEILPWSARLANALVSYVRYLEKMFRFDELAVFYPHPGAWPVWEVIASGTFLALSVAFVLWRLRASPWLAVGWFWYLGLLVPVIGLVQVGSQSLADRYSYLPSIGVLLLAAWSIPQRWFQARAGRLFLGLATAAALATLSMFTRIQIGYWRDSQTLFEHALAVTENNPVAHQSLGALLAQENRYPEALGQLNRAIALQPGYAQAYANRGACYLAYRRYAEALADEEKAIELDPNNAEAYINRAVYYFTQQQYKRAWDDVRRSRKLGVEPNPVFIRDLAAASGHRE